MSVDAKSTLTGVTGAGEIMLPTVGSPLANVLLIKLLSFLKELRDLTQTGQFSIVEPADASKVL
jgi:hypothetical protein